MGAFLSKLEDHSKEKKAEEVKVPKATLSKIDSRHYNYFEGEIQLRKVTPEIINYVLKRIGEAGETVPQVVEHDLNSVDIQVSSKKIIRQIANELVRKFGGEMSEHERLHSSDRLTSKLRYRLNMLYKKHDYDKGCVIILEDEPFLVHGFQDARLKVESLITRKNTQIRYKEAMTIIQPQKLQVIQDEPSICVLDENYQSIQLQPIPEKMKLDYKIKKGKKINVALFEGKAYFAEGKGTPKDEE
jgi:NMD protein affecting ribosome stability and mRNA decay